MLELSLFTGAGGGLLGTTHLLGWQCVGAVEIDDYCCKVLKARQSEGHLKDFPIWHMDIREFNRRVAVQYEGLVDVVSAGFPCQPFSVAGKQQAADDERNMWPATIECIRVVRPRYVFLENVPGLLAGSHGYFGQILRDLAESGYDVRWRCLSAAEVGAPHRRNRLWVVGHSKELLVDGGNYQQSTGWPQIPKPRNPSYTSYMADTSRPEVWRGPQEAHKGEPDTSNGPGECGEDVADTEAANRWRTDGAKDTGWRDSQTGGRGIARGGSQHWPTEPDVGRVVAGLASRVDRLKALGNGQVPRVVAAAWGLLTDD